MNCIYFDSIDSTNEYLKKYYQKLDNLTFVSSKSQSQGKGRKGRTWSSIEGNLYFSYLLKNNRLIQKYSELSIISAYSVLQVLEKYDVKNLSIKWPNDIYVNDKKICGVLLEAISKQEIECLIVGIGLNVNQDNFSNDFIHEPTSIKLETNKTIDLDLLRNDLYQKIINNLNKVIDDCSFFEEISKYDYLKGKSAYALVNNVKKNIKVLNINENYTLKIQVDNKIMDIESGEISFHI